MRWPTALLLAALGTAGCRNQPTSDPFFPRTTIPPPPTGSATGAPDAYYTNPAPPMSGSAPPFVPPSTGAPPANPPGNLYSPPGGFQYQQSPTMAPGSSGYAPTPGPAPRGSASLFQPTREVKTVQYEEPNSGTTVGQVPRMKQTKYVRTADTQPSPVYDRGGPVEAGVSAPAEAAADSSSEAIDIMDLPSVQRSGR